MRLQSLDEAPPIPVADHVASVDFMVLQRQLLGNMRRPAAKHHCTTREPLFTDVEPLSTRPARFRRRTERFRIDSDRHWTASERFGRRPVATLVVNSERHG